MEDPDSDHKLKWMGLLALTVAYLVIFLYFDQLRFPIRKDEEHFWPTTLLFSKNLFPTVALLRTYGELNTPLPFMVFGLLEYLFHGGIVVGRYLNFILSYVILVLVLFPKRSSRKKSLLAVLGIAIFPYYIGCAVHLYTDIMASFLTLLGLILYARSRYVLGCLSFILAIASRQYMVAFPAALFLFEIYQARGNIIGGKLRLASLLLALSSLLGWVLFFGGFGPHQEMARQHIATAGITKVMPEHSLYFLACIGIYFVFLEAILFRTGSFVKDIVSRRGVFLSVALLLLFILFPPLENRGYFMPTMGYFDKAVRTVLPDMLRMGFFYVLALAACLRFSRIDLSFWLLLMNALIMMKSHVAWDKYAMPLLIVLWYLKIRGQDPGPRVAPTP